MHAGGVACEGGLSVRIWQGSCSSAAAKPAEGSQVGSRLQLHHLLLASAMRLMRAMSAHGPHRLRAAAPFAMIIRMSHAAFKDRLANRLAPLLP